MRRALRVAAAFAYLVLLIEAIRSAVAWWRAEPPLTALDYALACLLPLLIWIWLRYFSLFRRNCRREVCAPPPGRRS